MSIVEAQQESLEARGEYVVKANTTWFAMFPSTWRRRLDTAQRSGREGPNLIVYRNNPLDPRDHYVIPYSTTRLLLLDETLADSSAGGKRWNLVIEDGVLRVTHSAQRHDIRHLHRAPLVLEQALSDTKETVFKSTKGTASTFSIFHGDDATTHDQFQSWRRTHVDGFHMTEGSLGVFTIHYTQDKRENAAGRGCIHQGTSEFRYHEDKNGCYTSARKVCSTSYPELLSWTADNGFVTKNCKHCDTRRFPFPGKDIRDSSKERTSQSTDSPREQSPGETSYDPAGSAVHSPLPRTTPSASLITKPLAERSDEDIEYVRDAASVSMRLKHNEMTNDLQAACRRLGRVVQEGADPKCLFDALILDYRGGGRHLLVEVKTASSPPFCRMAVGQLLDYRRRLPQRTLLDLAVLLPNEPDGEMRDYLADVGVIPLWFDTARHLAGLK